MPPLQDGPWLAAAPSIGPLQQVCRISNREEGKIAGLTLLFVVGSPFALAFLAFLTCAAVNPRLDVAGQILCLFVVAWVILCLVAILYAFEWTRRRLLLGTHGIAVWLPWRTTVVLFDDLCTVWRYLPLHTNADEPPALLLEHTSGRRVAITSAFEDHHQVALRVLEELERRTPEREPEPRPEGTDAIKPANRDISEPREETP